MVSTVVSVELCQVQEMGNSAKRIESCDSAVLQDICYTTLSPITVVELLLQPVEENG